MAKKKKEVLDNPQTMSMEERTVYKSFVQFKDCEDMQVDTGGDTFSTNPTDAAIAYLQTLTMNELFMIPGFSLFLIENDSDDEIPVENKSGIVADEKHDRFVVLKLTANDGEDFQRALDGNTDLAKYPDFGFKVNELKEGYRTAIGEYKIEYITATQKKNAPSITISMLEMKLVGESQEFPAVISFNKRSRKKKDDDEGGLSVGTF